MEILIFFIIPIFSVLIVAFIQLIVLPLINQNENIAQGCFMCLCLLLGFANPFFWIIAFIIAIPILDRIVTGSFISPANNSQPSTTRTPSPASSLPVPDDLDNILMDLSNGEIKDPVTQEIFHPGEKVYLCHVHRLAYHEDSWQEMECRCMVCGNSAHTKLYVLPHPVNINLDIAKKLKNEFRDIE